MNANERQALQVSKRTVLGSKVKKLRVAGQLPGNVYGPGRESMAVEMDAKSFEKIFTQIGESALLDLAIGNEHLPVLIKEVARDPASYAILHVDFYAVNLKEKVTVTVPLEFVGEPPAVKNGLGVLIRLFDEMEVACLPDRIPSVFQIDVSSLANVDAAITVGDIKLEEGVALDADPAELICKIEEPTKEEEPVVAELPEAEGAEEAVEGASEDKAMEPESDEKA